MLPRAVAEQCTHAASRYESMSVMLMFAMYDNVNKDYILA